MTATTPSISRRTGTLSIVRRSVGQGVAENLPAGDRIRICPLHRGDWEDDATGNRAIAPDARRFHFRQTTAPPDEAFRQMLPVFNPRSDIIYVAVIDGHARNHEVGVARLSAVAGSHGCEFDVVVAASWRRKGIGTRLMHHLIETARRRGLQTLYSSDAADHAFMDSFSARLDMQRDRHPLDERLVSYLLLPRHT